MRNSKQATHGYAIADAEHVLRAAQKHWAAMQSRGVTEAERKKFTQNIAEADKLSGETDESAPPLEKARQDLQDLVGEYRSAGSLVVHGMDGRDAKAEQALAMKGSFPGNDVALAAYVAGIGARMKPYAVKLAARGFSKEKQAELVVAGVAFAKAFAAVGKLRGEARSSTLARGAVFKELRTNTAYFRKAGREALKSVVARADFDRVKPSGGRGAAVVALPKQEAAAS